MKRKGQINMNIKLKIIFKSTVKQQINYTLRSLFAIQNNKLITVLIMYFKKSIKLITNTLSKTKVKSNLHLFASLPQFKCYGLVSEVNKFRGFRGMYFVNSLQVSMEGTQYPEPNIPLLLEIIVC